MKLVEQLKGLYITITERLESKIAKNGKDTGFTCSKGLEVKGDYYIDGRKITHITSTLVVAGGYHYSQYAVDIDELCEIVDNL